MSVVQSRSAAGEISRRSVQLLREYTGHGPTKARTVINDDSVLVLLADTLTKGERRLAEAGKAEHVLRTRQEYQKVMRDDLIHVVEEQTGRKVIAFLSDNHIDPDIAAEVFVLEENDGGSDPREGYEARHRQPALRPRGGLSRPV